jgi:hypothetical protein
MDYFKETKTQILPCIASNARFALGITHKKPSNNKTCSPVYCSKVVESLASEKGISSEIVEAANEKSRQIIVKKLLSLVLIFFALTFTANAQGTEVVTLTVSGQGESVEIATQNALRSAIERAFGTFISSKTEILNDELVKDEIVSVSSGNVQNFDVISEVRISDGGYAITLKATVSIAQLTSFAESKGIAVEFKGGLFAHNILLQELYERNEKEAIDNAITILNRIAGNSFEYSIKVADPVSNGSDWKIPVVIDVLANKNFENISNVLLSTIRSLSLTKDELKNYENLNKSFYPVTLITDYTASRYFLRNENSVESIIDCIYNLNSSIVNFNIDNGVERFHLSKYSRTMQLSDENFRFILKNGYTGGPCYICSASLFHNYCSDGNIPNFNYRGDYKDGNSYSIEYNDCFPGFSRKYSSEYELVGESYRLIRRNSGFYLGDLLQSRRISNYPHGTKKIYEVEGSLGLVVSFSAINLNSPLVQFTFHDLRSLEEIKKIKGFEIVKLD